MSNIIEKNICMPVDDDGYFRRSCPYCNNEFKIKKEDQEDLLSEKDYWCPYCGQTADRNKWWTREQIELRHKIEKNIAADIINRDLIKPLQRLHSPSSGIRVTTHELERGNELINPDINEMNTIPLPCCNKTIKIAEEWDKTVYCFYCGFPHSMTTKRADKGDR
jgi:uncharacterized Zn-finger protein